jgi:hypothetical protein
MWVIDVDGEEVPLIAHENAVVELVTKTKAQQESDDQGDVVGFAELLTKTRSQTEKDDDNGNLFASLELATKTETQLERDDTSSETTAIFL